MGVKPLEDSLANSNEAASETDSHLALFGHKPGGGGSGKFVATPAG